METRIILISRLKSFIFGLQLPWQSFKLIVKKPKLLIWSIIPILITFSLYTFLIIKIQGFLSSWLTAHLLGWGFQTSTWISYTLSFVAQIALILLSGMSFTFVAALIACPFNDFLAEETENFTLPPISQQISVSLRVRWGILFIDFLKSLFALGVSLIAVLISWIPGINFFSFFITLFLLCFQFISYPQTRRKEGIRDGFQFIWNHIYSCMGFGIVTGFLLSIPIVSSFILPLSVVGGTILYARAKRDPMALR